MRPADKKFVARMLAMFCEPMSKQPASEWVEQNLNLNEPKIKGRFSFKGRQYLREFVDAWGHLPPTLANGKNFTFVGGTGVGKTIATVAGICSRIALRPMRALIVKPSDKGAAGARSFSKTRLGNAIRATKVLADKIPTGARRFDFSASQMIINGSVIDLTGSNSVSQLGENRCDVVLQDEIDKYPPQTDDSKEASKVVLADERKKNVIGARGYKLSTPTLPAAGIWAILKSSDIRRRFLPCPHCNPGVAMDFDPEAIKGNIPVLKGWVVLAWSKRYSVLDQTGNEAFVKWDPEAKVDGQWDYNKVRRTAHYECPHCQGKIRSVHSLWMDEHGIFIQSAKSPIPGEIGWHVSSLYSTAPDCAVGELAVKFLKAKRSPDGVKGFINSDLAEPDMQQDFNYDRVGAVSQRIEITGEWIKLMTVDYHQNAPYFWGMIRAWDGFSKSHGLRYFNCNQWHEIDEIQIQEDIDPICVGVDVGFEHYEVLRNCAAINIGSRCTLIPGIQDNLPQCVGWTPMKAFGGKNLYRDVETGLYLPIRLKRDSDPYCGTNLAHKMQIELVEFLSDVFEDMMENIRMGKTGVEWTISPEVDTEEYHNHMAGKKRVYKKNNSKAYKWETIRSGYQDHLHACELNQLVLAHRLRLINFEAIQSKNDSPK